MRGEKHYLMSQTQLNRYHVISMVIDKNMTNSEAAEVLDLSVRQIIRLKKGVKKEGPLFLVHKNKGRKPIHAFSEDFVSKIVALKKSDLYQDANFLHFQELLEKHENIIISYNALHTILSSNGINSPKKHRKRKVHHRRKRKAKEGQLIQIDASPHDWFGTGEKYDIHGAIDDSTGKIMGLYMTKNECRQGYFETLRSVISNYGIPVSIYTDRHTIFRSPKADKLTIEEQLAGKTVRNTQFGRAMKELGITMIPARSPQAKGRIERLWNTLQSRLPIEFKIADISTIEEANEFFSDYLVKFNEKFAIAPEDPISAFRTLPEEICLDNILCVKEERILDNGLTFSFYNQRFKVVSNRMSVYPKSKIKVLISPKFGVKAQYGEKIYNVTLWTELNKSKVKKTKTNSNKKYKPDDGHYYKYGHQAWQKITFEDSDRDILKMLEKIFLSQIL
jgi:transposase